MANETPLRIRKGCLPGVSSCQPPVSRPGPFRGVYKKTEGRNGVFPLGGAVQILEFEIAKVWKFDDFKPWRISMDLFLPSFLSHKNQLNVGPIHGSYMGNLRKNSELFHLVSAIKDWKELICSKKLQPLNSQKILQMCLNQKTRVEFLCQKSWNQTKFHLWLVGGFNPFEKY